MGVPVLLHDLLALRPLPRAGATCKRWQCPSAQQGAGGQAGEGARKPPESPEPGEKGDGVPEPSTRWMERAAPGGGWGVLGVARAAGVGNWYPGIATPMAPRTPGPHPHPWHHPQTHPITSHQVLPPCWWSPAPPRWPRGPPAPPRPRQLQDPAAHLPTTKMILWCLSFSGGGNKRKIINLKAKRAPSNKLSPAAGLSPPQWGDRPLPTPGCEAATRAPCPRHLRGLGRRSWPGWCTGTPLSSAPGLSLGPGTPPAPRRRSLSSVSGWGPAGLPGGATSIPVAGSGSCPWHGCLECLV